MNTATSSATRIRSRFGWADTLPSSWQECHLRWLAALYAGGTPDKERPDYWEAGTIPWLKSGAVNQGLVTEPSAYITEQALANSSTRWVPESALVMALAGQGKTKGMVAQLAIRATCNQSMAAIVPSRIHPRYLYYWLAAHYRRIRGLASDDLRDGLNLQMLGDIPVPIPSSTAIQEHIANFLDEKTARIDALIAEKERLVERLREHDYSYTSALITRGSDGACPKRPTGIPELGDIPAHWSVKRLKFLAQVRAGVTKGKDLAGVATVSLPYLRVANVQDGYLDLTEVSNIEVPASDSERYLLKNGDVLMNEGGDNDKLGRGAVWQGQIDPCIHQNHVYAVRLLDLELAEWVARFTTTDAARTYFFLRSKQSTNLASINQADVRELPVPMPPPDERIAILAELSRFSSAVTALVDHATRHIARLNEYRASLISAAVTGQIAL